MNRQLKLCHLLLSNYKSIDCLSPILLTKTSKLVQPNLLGNQPTLYLNDYLFFFQSLNYLNLPLFRSISTK